MRSERNDAERIAVAIGNRFEGRWLRTYVCTKLRSDLAYEAAREAFEGSDLPILDIGCGVGLLGLYLRESGHRAPFIGIDADEKKIAAARRVAANAADMHFEVRDAIDDFPFAGNVALIDVLHYLPDSAQESLLSSVAERIPSGGIVLIRDCPKDGSWRERATWLEEVFARGIGWMQTERINFPPVERICRPFDSGAFEQTIRPLWGRTPFNSHLFLFRRR